MQDRRRRTALHLPPPAGPVLLPRERQSSSTGPSGTEGSSGSSGTPDTPDSGADAGSGTGFGSGSGSGAGSGPGAGSGSGPAGSGGSSGPADDNPFAPPPEGAPDQPWRPRHPEGAGPAGDGSGSGSGSDRGGWGSQWSSRQPGRSSGGFGSRPGNQNGQHGRDGGQDGPEGGRGGGLRWDPTDPIQRRARYALLGGMWAFFFALFDFPEIALLLGALALYWGISSLRNKPVTGSSAGRDTAADGGSPTDGSSLPAPAAGQNAPAATPGRAQGPGGAVGPAGPTGPPSRQQTTAAVSGLVTAGIALAIVAATFTVQIVYRDYYTCLNDSLTKTGQLSCNEELPPSLVPVFGVKE
ncbi:hypothetical protein ACFYYH_11800 [Streptomyces sp. NPDC002018]|uniref:hypothetical protein n=1 Tax=Streptomyces sp. NPDC002018 TaxID=3364629 RepID=UPI0036CEF04F